ncbi:MAG: glycosyltransferase, partial [Aeriscardovia sp.]|nr:glycosyltransferase [Aeriscardovia sp.]
MKDKLSVVLAGAGTAGHINTLISIAEQIKILSPDTRITVVGAKGGMEETLVPDSGLTLKTIPKLAFPRSLSPSAALFPAKWAKEVKDAEKILRAVDADCVAGVGGYVSAPCYRAAKKLKIPIAIHEQNAMAGIANKLGARWADYIGTAYEGAKLKPGRAKTIEKVGLPLKAEVMDAARSRREDPEEARKEAIEALGLKPKLPVLLVTGGSLGALSINKAVAGASRELLQVCQVVHVCGRGKSEVVSELVTKLAGKDAVGELLPSQEGQYFAQDGNYRIVDYFPHMSLLYKAASLAICRSGAGTVNEMEA